MLLPIFLFNKMKLFHIFLLVTNRIFANFAQNEKEDVGIYDKLFKEWKQNYDRRIRPYENEKPVDVEVFIYVLTIRSVSEVTMDYKLELYFREYWNDPRLAYSPMNFNNMSEISLHESLAELLWVPDTFLPNAIHSNNPSSNSITHRSLLRLKHDGHLLYSRRLSITAECPMKLSFYPFDQQVCRLSIESYGNDIDNIIYKWSENSPVTINERLELPDFKLKKVLTRKRNVTLATGTYSRLECCFFFVRNSGFYFVQLFIPATAIVVTSWLSLLMERESTFSDMIQVILAITFLYYSYNTVMPKVSYIKAMDIYLGTCFIFVFFSLLKLAVLKFLKRSSASIVDNGQQGQGGSRRKIYEKPFNSKQHSRSKLMYLSLEENGFARLHGNGDGSSGVVNDRLTSGRKKSSPKGKFVEFPSSGSTLTSGQFATPIERKCYKVFRIFALSLFPTFFVGFCSFYFFVYFRNSSEEGENERCVFGI